MVPLRNVLERIQPWFGRTHHAFSRIFPLSTIIYYGMCCSVNKERNARQRIPAVLRTNFPVPIFLLYANNETRPQQIQITIVVVVIVIVIVIVIVAFQHAFFCIIH